MNIVAAICIGLLAVVIGFMTVTTAFNNSNNSNNNNNSIQTWFKSKLSRQLRAPQIGSPFGWLATFVMKHGNKLPAEEIITLLELEQYYSDNININKSNNHDDDNNDNHKDMDNGLVIVEIGPGLGMSMEPLLQRYYYNYNKDDNDNGKIGSNNKVKISKIHGFEVSESFHKKLNDKFQKEISHGIVEIHNQDALVGLQQQQQQQLQSSSSSSLLFEDNSVDIIYALNVVYFLNPLEDYLKEFYRVLKKKKKQQHSGNDDSSNSSSSNSNSNSGGGGKVIFGVSNAVQTMDPTVFVNTDWDDVVDTMKRVGFDEAYIGPCMISSMDVKGAMNVPVYPIIGIK